MSQYADHSSLLTSLPTVKKVLDNHASALGQDLIPYRNQVYWGRESVPCDRGRQPRRARGRIGRLNVTMAHDAARPSLRG
jgi:hypothetical protein